LRHIETSHPPARETGETMAKPADLKKRLMANSEFQKEYEAVDTQFSFLERLVRAHVINDMHGPASSRTHKGWSY
jgi:hypothetical protein